MNPFITFGGSNKLQTEESFVIEWADTLIANARSSGELDTKCFALDYHLSKFSEQEIKSAHTNPSNKFRDTIIHRIKQEDKGTIQLEPIVKELLKYRNLVVCHLLRENYIRTIEFDGKWVLTERGKLMKELGGHSAYKKYRKSEIELITNQGSINKLLITATALAAVMPFLAAWLFTTEVYNTNVLPESASHQRNDVDTVWLRNQVEDLMQRKLSTPTPPPPTKKLPPTRVNQ